MRSVYDCIYLENIGTRKAILCLSVAVGAAVDEYAGFQTRLRQDDADIEASSPISCPLFDVRAIYFFSFLLTATV